MFVLYNVCCPFWSKHIPVDCDPGGCVYPWDFSHGTRVVPPVDSNLGCSQTWLKGIVWIEGKRNMKLDWKNVSW